MKINKAVISVVLVTLLTLLSSATVAGQGPVTPQGDISIQDQLILDDMIIDGSLCVGYDCTNGEFFDYDTLILKENNLRIYFNDTSSSASFPSNDWRITINDAANGGAAYFRIEDVTAGTSPLTILGGSNNVGIGTGSPSEKLEVAGNVLVNGSITESSDVNAKENFAPVDGEAVLDRLNALSITTWNYKADDPATRHMGPMAQDFYAAFELGQDERHIAALDANGVALAAIQALSQELQEKDVQIAELQQQNRDLASRLTALETLIYSMRSE